MLIAYSSLILRLKIRSSELAHISPHDGTYFHPECTLGDIRTIEEYRDGLVKLSKSLDLLMALRGPGYRQISRGSRVKGESHDTFNYGHNPLAEYYVAA
jgi:hypothetical protein